MGTIQWSGLYSHIHMAVSMYNTTRARLPLVVNLLLRYGAKCRGQGLLTWVIITLSEHPTEREMVWTMHIMSELIRAGVDINEVPPEYKDECPPNAQEPPLIAAALSGSRSFVCFLLSHSADKSIRHQASGRTAFECAYDAFPLPGDSKRREQLVSIFAENGVSPATLFGILESKHDRKHPRYCRCSQRSLGPIVPDPEMRFQPVLKPEI
jgi:ankyrin repeat protein